MVVLHRQGQKNRLTRRQMLIGAGLGAVAVGTSACGSDTPEEEAGYESYTVADSSEQAAGTGNDEALARALEQIKTSAKAEQLSVTVYSYTDGTTFYYNPDFEGYEASTVKVPIALSVLRQNYNQGVGVNDYIADLIGASLGMSDNEATMELFGLLGEDLAAQDAAVNETYDMLGISRTRCVEGWGNNLTNTEDQVALIKAVYQGVDWVGAEDMNLMRVVLEATDSDSQGWGVGVLSEVGDSDMRAERVICKNGWITDDQDIWFINTTGAFLYREKTYAVSAMTTGFTQQEEGRRVVSSAVEKVMEYLAD